jgi:hypothetical protein
VTAAACEVDPEVTLRREIRRHLALHHRTFVEDSPNRDAFIIRYGNGSVDARPYFDEMCAQRSAVEKLAACKACATFRGVLASEERAGLRR